MWRSSERRVAMAILLISFLALVAFLVGVRARPAFADLK